MDTVAMNRPITTNTTLARPVFAIRSVRHASHRPADAPVIPTSHQWNLSGSSRSPLMPAPMK